MAATRSPKLPEVCDVLVIGAGASGSVAVHRLAAAGMSVVCLEQGGWVNTSEFPSPRMELDLLAAGPWHPNPNVRRRPADYPVEVTESDINPLMFNAVGGGTIHFAAEWPRLIPSDFRVRSLDGIAFDWPISYEDLAPFYDRLEPLMGVSGLAGDPAYPPRGPYPMPALPIGKAGRKAVDGLDALGWHWWVGAHAIPSQAWGRQAACTRRGACMTGCAEGAKGSTDITLWPDAIANGARLVTGARVREITVDDRGLASGAIFIDREGNEQRQRARSVIVAANGVGTPRLLLLSTSPAHPDGLGNSSGLVGKNLMMHPCVTVLGEYDEDLDSWLGPFGSPVWCYEFYETDPARDFPRGAKWGTGPVAGPLELLTRLASEHPEVVTGVEAQRAVRRALGRAFDWTISIEDLPEESNRVTLDPALADGDGIPAPRLHYAISEWSRRNLAFQVARAREAHEAGGARATSYYEWMPDVGWHLLGTCRMGDDPATSVVDRYGRSHDVPNLFLVDGSVFVTSGSANPTATICAIALRTAEHLIETASQQRGVA